MVILISIEYKYSSWFVVSILHHPPPPQHSTYPSLNPSFLQPIHHSKYLPQHFPATTAQHSSLHPRTPARTRSVLAVQHCPHLSALVLALASIVLRSTPAANLGNPKPQPRYKHTVHPQQSNHSYQQNLASQTLALQCILVTRPGVGRDTRSHALGIVNHTSSIAQFRSFSVLGVRACFE
jgi:hypothetical protein